ncbi:MAG TPA: DUF1993 domain-containing protein [Steroidobacteraceae bacterium]|nr:DUF1993 domain-containing protein [Steroidobacteraceae bacterium]
MNLNDLLVPTYVQMLQALATWLRKAQAERPPAEAESLLAARLAPDMFPLSTQIRFACVQAQEGMCRLHGKAFPASLQALLDEARNAGERPGSIAEALARIDETVALVKSLALQPCDQDEQRPVAHALPAGMIFDLTAAQFARDWAVPQFYFHVMTAYAILRNQGIGLGKADYVAHMLGFLRPGTLPQ